MLRQLHFIATDSNQVVLSCIKESLWRESFSGRMDQVKISACLTLDIPVVCPRAAVPLCPASLVSRFT